jgi:hypothetical protein
MNLITAIILGLWITGWALASVREILKARTEKVNHSIISGRIES